MNTFNSCSHPYELGDMINNWQIIKKEYLGIYRKQPTYKYTILCTCCNETTRIMRQSELPGLGSKCNKCMLMERNTEKAKSIIGQKFGHLTVIGDAGYKVCNKNGHRRHYSLVVCDCGKTEPFEVRDNSLKTGSVSSCGCAKHKSRGEYEIYKVLEELYPYSFSTEYSFADLVSPIKKRRLRFDFALFDKNKKLMGLIEFDGRQHEFGPDTTTWSRTEDSLEDIQERDKLKNDYCQQHGIPLCRINYKDFVKIPILLEDFINNLLKGGDAYE